MKYDAVLLDFDGTIADTGEGIYDSVRYAVRAMGFDPLPEEVMHTFIGPPVFSSFKRALNLSDEDSAKAVEKYRESYMNGGIYRLSFYDGMEKLLNDIKKSGIKLAVASSKPENFIIEILKYLKISDLFDFISAPESDKAPESKTALVERAVKALGIDKSKAVMIGDRYFDIEGAKEAKVDSIGVTFGFGDRNELINSGADYIADSTEDIRRIIFS
ncbi:MAG: HAD hydrolase-like protein [Acutalibacteraceae bacterium]|nr:HAD hydrolase-like protein [Acutalibacteraceae bacterium]